DPAFSGGVAVATDDVSGDGIAEIVTGAGPGGGPHGRVWSTTGGAITELDGTGFCAYAPTFAGGVFVAAGDVNGDGRADLLTGPGEGSVPEVRIWELNGSAIAGLASF